MSEVTNTLTDLARSIGIKVGEILGSLLSQLPGMALALAVIAVSSFFFLMDGRKLILFIRRTSFFTGQQTDLLIVSLAGICRSVILASVISGTCQAIFELLVLVSTGIPNALMWAVICFVSSFVPLIGTAPVTFGLAIHQFILGNTAIGVILTISAVVVTTMDNFIRPWVLKGSSNLHPLLAFVAAFGGLQTLGFAGIFLGPIIAALLLATIRVMTESDGERVGLR